MIRVYLSGQISGLPLRTAQRNFEKAKRSAIKYYTKVRGYNEADIVIINPLEIKPFLGCHVWLCHMISDVSELKKCDEIYHLNDWVVSPGASIEHYVALRRKLKIQYHHKCKAELKAFYVNLHSNKLKTA